MTRALTGPTARDEKFQPGPGLPGGVVEILTVDIPGTCTCSWAARTSGGPRQAVSRLKYMHTACPNLRAHKAAIQKAAGQGLW